MSEVMLIPLKQGTKFELRMFVQPIEQHGTQKPEKTLFSSPRTHGKKYLNKEVILRTFRNLS